MKRTTHKNRIRHVEGIEKELNTNEIIICLSGHGYRKAGKRQALTLGNFGFK